MRDTKKINLESPSFWEFEDAISYEFSLIEHTMKTLQAFHYVYFSS
ncbi:MAG: hypothetical protein QXV53_04500 [Zestosphaera sp.]